MAGGNELEKSVSRERIQRTELRILMRDKLLVKIVRRRMRKGKKRRQNEIEYKIRSKKEIKEEKGDKRKKGGKKEINIKEYRIKE